MITGRDLCGRLFEDLDLTKYQAAWADVIEASDILRSRFVLSRTPFVQVVRSLNRIQVGKAHALQRVCP